MSADASRPWSPDQVPTFWINHASRLLMRRFEQALRPIGFGLAYLPVAVALERRGPLVQAELAQVARVEQPTMALLLKRMERDGVVERRPRDGRAVEFSLTAEAGGRLAEAKARLTDAVDEALRGLTDAQRDTLVELLRVVVGNLDR